MPRCMLWTGLHQHLKYRFGDKSDAIKDSAELRRAIRPSGTRQPTSPVCYGELQEVDF